MTETDRSDLPEEAPEGFWDAVDLAVNRLLGDKTRGDERWAWSAFGRSIVVAALSAERQADGARRGMLTLSAFARALDETFRLVANRSFEYDLPAQDEVPATISASEVEFPGVEADDLGADATSFVSELKRQHASPDPEGIDTDIGDSGLFRATEYEVILDALTRRTRGEAKEQIPPGF